MKSVVVTGVSTGIGRACVKVLAANGFRVFGSVLDPLDADRLSQEFGENFSPLVFDVTDRTAVAAGARQVETALRGETLSGLVNNAGIAVPGPLLYLKIEDFERQIAVNLAGHLIVTQAFAPFLGVVRSLKGPPGRIVMITSLGGKIALPLLARLLRVEVCARGDVGKPAPRVWRRLASMSSSSRRVRLRRRLLIRRTIWPSSRQRPMRMRFPRSRATWLPAPVRACRPKKSPKR